MLFEVHYDHAPFPKPGSRKAKKLAAQLHDWYRHERDARGDLENNIWPACDRAYQGLRILPKNKAMVWVDKSDKGESDIGDSVDFLVDTMMMSMLGRDGAWFQPVSYSSEDQSTQNVVRDYLYARHRDAGTRDQLGIHYNQVFRRGTGAYSSEWRKVYKVVRYDSAEAGALVDAAAQQVSDMGVEPTDELVKNMRKQIQRERKMVLAYNGPVVRPLDMFDVILDSTSSLRSDGDTPMCTITYRSIDELKNAVGPDGKPLYGNLDELTEWTPQQIYTMAPGRYQSLQATGVNPLFMADISGSSFVPVLIFHRQVQKLDGSDDKWIDSFFHVALADSGTPVLILSQENPSDQGHRDVFVDSYRDWCTSAYGRGVVENAIGNWEKKNIASALTLNAMMIEVFPPLAMITDMLVDDRRADVSPGGFNLIEYKQSIGTNFIAPLPITQQGAEKGMQYERWLGQKILGQMSAFGAIMQDPTKNISQSKTATQINTESSTGTTTQQNFLEKASRGLEPFAQKFYDDCRQYEEDDMISFIVGVESGDPKAGEIAKSILDKDRRIIVTGYHGLLNKQQQLQNYKDIFQILSTGNAAQFLADPRQAFQIVLLELLGALGMKDLDQLKQSAFDNAKADPQYQQVIVQMLQQLTQQGALSPQVAAMLGQVLLPPQLMQPGAPAPGQPGQPPPSPGGATPGAGAPSMPPPGPPQKPGGPPPHVAAQQGPPQAPHPALQGGQDIA